MAAPARTSPPRTDPRLKRVLARDPLLAPHAEAIRRRLALADQTEARLTGGRRPLGDFASGHEYFGLHLRGNQWVLREWAPNAERLLMVGEATEWQERPEFEFTPKGTKGCGSSASRAASCGTAASTALRSTGRVGAASASRPGRDAWSRTRPR